MVARLPLVIDDDCEVQRLQPGDTLVGGSLPPAIGVGQVLLSKDGISFSPEDPLVSCQGWLVNDNCLLLVKG